MSIKSVENVNNHIIGDNRSIHCDRDKNMKLDTRPTIQICLRARVSRPPFEFPDHTHAYLPNLEQLLGSVNILNGRRRRPETAIPEERSTERLDSSRKERGCTLSTLIGLRTRVPRM